MLGLANLKPASSDEIADTLSHALLYDRRRRVHDADRLIARIAAVRRVEHLAADGFVSIEGQKLDPMCAEMCPCN
jgi:hypothetical protein